MAVDLRICCDFVTIATFDPEEIRREALAERLTFHSFGSRIARRVAERRRIARTCPSVFFIPFFRQKRDCGMAASVGTLKRMRFNLIHLMRRVAATALAEPMAKSRQSTRDQVNRRPSAFRRILSIAGCDFRNAASSGIAATANPAPQNIG